MLAALYGATVDTDTYFLALIVPTLVGGVLMEGLYTVLLRSFERDLPPSLAATLRIAVPTTGAALAAYVAALAALGPARLDVWLAFAPILFTTALGGVFAAHLMVERRYVLATMRVPLASGLALVVVAVVMSLWRSVTGFALAMSAGHVIALTFIAFRAGAGGAAARPLSRVRTVELLSAAVPIFLATLVGGQAVIVIERFFASGLGAGAVTLISLARGIALIPVQVAQALGNAILPAAAERQRLSGRAAVARLAVLGIRLGIVAALVSTAYTVICRREIVQLVLQRGNLDAREAAATATLAALLAIALVGLSTATIAAKALYALGRQRTVAVVTTAGVLLYIALAFPARAAWDIKGLALAFSAAALVAGAVTAAVLAAESRITVAQTIREWLLIPTALGGSFAAGAYGVWALTSSEGGGTPQAVEVLLGAACGGIALLAVVAAALRGPEWDFFRLALRRVSARFASHAERQHEPVARPLERERQ